MLLIRAAPARERNPLHIGVSLVHAEPLDKVGKLKGIATSDHMGRGCRLVLDDDARGWPLRALLMRRWLNLVQLIARTSLATCFR